jgi:molecular chaperone GrpE (heat shock protein)
VEIRELIDLFIENYLEPKQLSQKILADYRTELTLFEQYGQIHHIQLQPSEIFIQALERYFEDRLKDLSPTRQDKIRSRFRSFFKYLHIQGLLPYNVGFILPELLVSEEISPATGLLNDLRQLEEMLYDLKRIGSIRKRFSNLKKDVISIGKSHLPLADDILKSGIEEARRLKVRVKEELDKQTNELFWVGSVILNSDLANFTYEIKALGTNISKMGREQFKANSIDEARQESNKQFYEYVQTHFENTEKLLNSLSGLHSETRDKLNDDFIKELLPVLDGLEEAIRLIPDRNQSLPQKSGAREGLFKQLFAASDAENEPEKINFNQWFDGLKIIQNRLLAVFRKRDIEPIESVGQQFNPKFHIAVGIETRNDVAENIIIEEQLKGYYRKDEVIRFAEVIVAKPSPMER